MPNDANVASVYFYARIVYLIDVKRTIPLSMERAAMLYTGIANFMSQQMLDSQLYLKIVITFDKLPKKDSI